MSDDVRGSGGENIHIRIPTKPVTDFIKDKMSWVLLAVMAWLGVDGFTKVKAINAVNEAQTVAEETKDAIVTQDDNTAKAVTDKVDAHLENGFAKKIAKEVAAEILPAIRGDLKEFLLGDGAAPVPPVARADGGGGK